MAAGDTCQEAIEYGDLGEHARPADDGTWFRFTAPRAGTFTFTFTRSTFGTILVAHYSAGQVCDAFRFGGIVFSPFAIADGFVTVLTQGASFYFRVNSIDEPYSLSITGPAAPAVADVDRTAVNQKPGGGTDYPFAAENFLAGRVLDLYLSYADPSCAYALPFSLTVAGDTYTVTDAAAAVVASGDTADAASTAWGDRTVYEWVGDEAVLRVVVRDDKVEDGSGALDPRTSNRLAARVDSLAVYADLSAGRRKTGTVALQTGYNTDLTYLEPPLVDGGRYVRQIRVDVTPAGGIGRAPGCEALVPAVRSINNVRPAAGGNFLLTPAGGEDDGTCFRLAQPTARTGDVAVLTAGPNALRLASDCAPCCSCDYYVRTYEGLRRVVGKWQALADDAQAVRDVYRRNRERWLAQRTCRLNNPLSLVAVPLKECFLSIAVNYCNMNRVCLRPDLELRVTVEVLNGTTPSVICQPAYINGSHTNGDLRYFPRVAESPAGGHVFTSVFPYLDPQDQAHARFRVTQTCEEGTAVKVTATVHVGDVSGAELPTLDDGSAWGSELPTRAKEVLLVGLLPDPSSYCDCGVPDDGP